jgi:hypothetical protein
MKANVLLICTIFSLTSCFAQLKKGLFSVKEGITGKVTWKEGNYMPSPDAARAGNGIGVKREVYVFELINMSGAVKQNGLFEISQSPLVKTESTKNGFFEIILPPGKYSVFTKEVKGFFANRFDGKGNINPVEVLPGKATYTLIAVDYKASY